MKLTVLIMLICLVACNGNHQQSEVDHVVDSAKENKVLKGNEQLAMQKDSTADSCATAGKIKTSPKIYSNARFKNVTVEKQPGNKFLLKGKAQIFEASFNWVLEDGHNELQKGYSITDAGAPEWGNFKFTVVAAKKRENSTLHLILFETCAKDGSRKYELPILLL